MKIWLLSVATGLVLSAPAGAWAQSVSGTVTASDPATVSRALQALGYDARADTDSMGDPLIHTELSGRQVAIVFYGCREKTNDRCDQLQFRLGFDSEEPVSAERLVELMGDQRFTSLSLDEEGDPWLSWDVVTGIEGIPTGVFLQGVRHFSDAIDAAERMIWPD